MTTALVERIMPRVERDPATGCWRWTGALSKGYGAIGISRPRRTLRVHRVLYEALVGPIPDGFTLDHTCHTDDQTCPGGDTCPHRSCVNPDHLEPVTLTENKRRGQSPTAVNARKTHCEKGHPLETVNGSRRCRVCRNAWRRSYSRHRQQRPEVKAQRAAAQRARRARQRQEATS